MAPFSSGRLVVNSIKPQGLEPFQFQLSLAHLQKKYGLIETAKAEEKRSNTSTVKRNQMGASRRGIGWGILDTPILLNSLPISLGITQLPLARLAPLGTLAASQAFHLFFCP